MQYQEQIGISSLGPYALVEAIKDLYPIGLMQSRET